MLIVSKQNQNELIKIVPSIKKNMAEWQIVNVNIIDLSSVPQQQILDCLVEQFKDIEGVLYPFSKSKILMLARLGILEDYGQMKQDIEDKMPGHSCNVILKKMSAKGLQQVQINLSQVMKNPEKEHHYDDDSMIGKRFKRNENVVLYITEEHDIKKVMNKVLPKYGHGFQINKFDDVIRSYQQNNPDAVFLDVRIGGAKGLSLIPKLIDIDPDAYIISIVPPANKEIVSYAIEGGALANVSKPPSEAEIIKQLDFCETIKKH